MPWGAIVGGVIGAAGSVIGGSEQASAAGDAAQTNLQEFNTITQQETPFMESGYGGLQSLDYLLGITPTTATGSAPGTVSTPTAVPGLGTLMKNGVYYDPNGPGIGSAFRNNGWDTQANKPLPGAATNTAGSAASPISSSSSTTSPVSSPAGGFGSLVTPFTTADWQQLSPMYNFQLQQGQQGVLNADSGSEGALSGAALKDLISYNQGTASQSFNNAFNLYQQQQGNIYNRLFGLTGLGQTAAANTGAQGTTLAGNIGSAQIAGGNAMGTAFSNMGNSIGNGANAWAAYNALNQPDYSPYAGSGPGTGTMDAGGGYTFNTGGP